LLLLFIKDLLVMGNQYFWWENKILDPGCPGTTTPLLDFRNPETLVVQYWHSQVAKSCKCNVTKLYPLSHFVS
jgi:hypothetical protein